MDWQTTSYLNDKRKRVVLHWPFVNGQSVRIKGQTWYVLEQEGKYIVRRAFSAQKNDQECPTLDAAKVAVALLGV